MMKKLTKLLAITTLVLSSNSSYANLLKENTYGTLYEQPTSESYRFESRNLTVVIKHELGSIIYRYPDGSWLKLNSRTATVERYSRKTGKTESYHIENPPSSPWNVSQSTLTAIENFKNFVDTPNMPQEPCYDGEISVPCGMSGSFVEPLMLPNTNSSADSCEYERAEFLNTPYNGHGSMFRCTLGANITYMSAGVGVAALAVGDPTKTSLALAWTGFMGTFVSAMDTAVACQNSYNVSYRALQQCKQQNGDGDDGGNNDGGNNGGGTGTPGDGGNSDGGGNGSPGGFCSVEYSVCTGGGCYEWEEVERC